MGMTIIGSNIASKVKNTYIEKGAKIASKIESLSDAKIEENSSAIELWQKARAASISWQSKNTPYAVFGDHKKLQDSVFSTIDKMGLNVEHPCFSGPDRYDEYIRIGSNWYYTDTFMNSARELGEDSKTLMQNIKKLYDDYGDISLYSCTKEYKGNDIVSDTINYILESQRRKRGY